MDVRTRLFRLAAGLLCAGPGFWAMWPVLLARHSAVPGLDPGDNLATLWNVWWFIEGAHMPGWPYWTPLLFAPVGTQLALHTHATTHSLLAWAGATFTSLNAAHNIALTLGLVLNGLVVYALALRATGRAAGAVAAGLLFAASPAVQVRALGHINLVHAWVVPLFVLALMHLVDRPGPRRAVLLGAAGALVLYTDYYYAVYVVLLTALWMLMLLVKVDVSSLPKRTGRTGTVLLGLIVVDLLVVAIIASTGGTSLDLGFARISLRGLRNPLTMLWCLAAAWLLWRFPRRVTAGWRGGRPTLRDALPALIAAGAFFLLASPLIAALARVVAAGDYTTQTVLWRSSPPGADVLTAFLGHPRHVLTGEWTRSLYAALGIDVMEQVLWLGIVPLVTLAMFAREWRSAAGVRTWIAVAVMFAIVALGPFLRVGGFDLSLPLPDALLRYLPVFSNARIPGRAVVMVQLAVAVLFAHAIARRSRPVAALVILLSVAESFPARIPPYALPGSDAVDNVLKTSSAAGAVAELPLGLRDGFSSEGVFDHRALVHQAFHGRPLVGGFVARLAPAVRTVYANDPAMAALLRVSTPGAEARLEADTGSRASEAGIAFLVVNRDTFVDPQLPRTELERAGFRFLLASGSRELYETVRAPANH